jgi:hypothetical protein
MLSLAGDQFRSAHVDVRQQIKEASGLNTAVIRHVNGYYFLRPVSSIIIRQLVARERRYNRFRGLRSVHV